MSLCECGDHAWMILTRGFVALVSPEDEHLTDHKWCANYSCRSYRVGRTVYENGGKRNAALARVIMDAAPGELVDHKNTNPLDNRRPNLRKCTYLQNNQNSRPRKNAKVPFKGVFPSPHSNNFVAKIRVSKKTLHLGTFPTAEQAYAAYVKAALIHHGEFARVA